MTPASPRLGPGVMGCCALPTVSGHSPFEQSADLPPIYEWFGYERRIGRLGFYDNDGLQDFWFVSES